MISVYSFRKLIIDRLHVMPKTILIYANCHNKTAKGDFGLAGNIAKDISKELASSDIDIVLTSSGGGIRRYMDLYGIPVDGRVNIEGQSIGLCDLESFDAVENEVIAFIESNRCNYAPTEVVKRVLAPNSKFLFIGAANQDAIEYGTDFLSYYSVLIEQQPDLYEYFEKGEVLIGATGLGENRLGLPKLNNIVDLPGLNIEQRTKIPTIDYGFMYLAALGNNDEEQQTINQFITLTGEMREYVLVGNFAAQLSDIDNRIRDGMISKQPQQPKIHFHQSIPNGLMRRLVVGSTGNLVLSTGVMSTLEVMHDKKLPFYQNTASTAVFEASYLLAVRSLISSRTSLEDGMSHLIIDLSMLLFASKPLTENQMIRTRELLDTPSVSTSLIATNQQIIKQVNGTLSGQLVRFMQETTHTKLENQYLRVCKSLLRSTDTNFPSEDKALRRAATLGHLFKLKILIKFMAYIGADLSKTATSGLKNTALHRAVTNGHADCVRLLIKAGASLDVVDTHGKTPVDYAVELGDQTMIQLLQDARNVISKIPADHSVESRDLLMIQRLKEALETERKKEGIINSLKLQFLSLKNKAEQLKVREFYVAYDVAIKLHENLERFKNEYSDNLIDYPSFKERSSAAIREAGPELEKHREWKEILGNILLCVLGLGIFYLGVCLYKSSFFKFETDSAKKLNELEASLEAAVPIIPQ
jgi:hypothetical protein